jgi:hypothetical protein
MRRLGPRAHPTAHAMECPCNPGVFGYGRVVSPEAYLVSRLITQTLVWIAAMAAVLFVSAGT